ncbi:MAG: cyclic nucleotide-binding domain-containing protein [bacterium]|nr:cyclic nucleotide-binding domain-containing protein [bacterium]
MINKEQNHMVIRLSLNHSGLFATKKVGQRIREFGTEMLGDNLELEVSGITFLLGECVNEIIAGQKRGLVFAFITIFLLMALALRSFKSGLMSMIPNIIPLVILGGYLGWAWESVDTDTLIVVMIAMGISVDNTIHFLFRYRFEYMRTAPHNIGKDSHHTWSENIARSLDRTFHFSGRAIVITSIILVAGFAPFAVSDYFSVKILGTLLPICFLAALTTDMLLIPALINLGAFSFGPAAEKEEKSPGNRRYNEYGSFAGLAGGNNEGAAHILPFPEADDHMPDGEAVPLPDPMEAGREGHRLHKEGKKEEALSYLWQAFRGFVRQGKYSMAVMVADELLAIRGNYLEILHMLSKLADKKSIEIPVLEIYKKYKNFHKLPLFAQLDEISFLQLLKSADFHHFKTGKTVIKEGERGESIFLLVEGNVAITRKSTGNETIRLGNLGVGDFLGEMAYMGERRRCATVTTENECCLLSWQGDAIRRLTRKHSRVAEVLFAAFWERSLDTVLCLSPLFCRLPMDKRKKLIGQFTVRCCSKGEVILREGEDNRETVIFVVKRGEVQVFSSRSWGKKESLAILGPGDVFGEYSVFTGKPANATVKARNEVEVLVLSRPHLTEIARDNADVCEALLEIGFSRFGDTVFSLDYFRSVRQLHPELPELSDG